MRNNWNVSYSRITWFQSLLESHGNVQDLERRDDIVFEFTRKKQKDRMLALCLYQYTMGLTASLRAVKEFPSVNLIHIGGGWCGYTVEAKEYLWAKKIGLYVSNEVPGALWKNDYWAYYQRDEKGNPSYYYRSE